MHLATFIKFYLHIIKILFFLNNPEFMIHIIRSTYKPTALNF